MKKQTIAIDCRPLQNRYAGRGVGTVVRNLLSHLVKSCCSASIVLCGKADAPPMHCGAYRKIMRPAGREWLWEQLLWPVDLARMGASIFHSTVSLGLIREIAFPLFCPAKSIATIYDLTPLHLPGLAPHTRMKSYRLQMAAVRRASRVLTISDYVKNDLVKTLGIKGERIRVLPLAVDDAVVKIFEGFSKSASPPQEQFLLAMGESENKNIAAVVGVFERLAARGWNGRLRIIGSLENQTEEVRRKVGEAACADRIIFTGEIFADQIVANYAACSLFLFPSTLEGFGLPVLEAMYCGAPVLCSNAASLPEAGGDAALYCSPADIDDMVAAAERVLNDPAYSRELIEKGRSRARSRTWAEAAGMVISLYEELGAKFGRS